MGGPQPATVLLEHNAHAATYGLVRVKGKENRPYIYSSVARQCDPISESELIVTTFPKRKDFLHPVNKKNRQNNAYTATQSFSVSDCTVENLPAKYAVLAAFVLLIMHRLDIALLA